MNNLIKLLLTTHIVSLNNPSLKRFFIFELKQLRLFIKNEQKNTALFSVKSLNIPAALQTVFNFLSERKSWHFYENLMCIFL